MRYEYNTINKLIENKAIGLLAISLPLVEKNITQKTKNFENNVVFLCFCVLFPSIKGIKYIIFNVNYLLFYCQVINQLKKVYYIFPQTRLFMKSV